ncbi:hypothetical protein [uncultured Cellulomonas sp.]|uniref:hypothetical protein n=1 Tax=uncultured Cellulomonas sp. TaxID=189682 RepID=UPI002613FE23|nr:hypothetical protein [uncultured Cellulomonas sp.]
MSVNEEDEMLGDVDRMVRTGVMAAGQIAERGARVSAERDRVALERQRTGRDSHERRFVADRDVARAFHSQVGDPSFWEKASPQRVAQTFAAAYQWRGHDAQAAVALEKFKEGMLEHRGVDVDHVLAGGLKFVGPLRENDPLAEVRQDPARRDFAEYVLGRFVAGAGTEQGGRREPEADAEKEQQATGERARGDVDDVLANAPADQDRVAAQDAAVNRDRAGAGSSGEAERSGNDALDVADARAPAPDLTGSAEIRQTVEETAQNFPTSTAEAMRSSHPAARARVVRGVSRTSGRSQDLGR